MIELTGPQRAAAVFAQLDTDRAVRLLGRLSEAEAVALTTEVARLPFLDPDALAEVVGELREKLGVFADAQGGTERAKQLLEARLGAARAEEIMAELETAGTPRPLAFLRSVEPSRLARFLEPEHPQLVAVVLSQLRRDQAGRVIDQLGSGVRTEVARRLATIRPLPQTAMAWLNGELEVRLFALARREADGQGIDGMTAIVDILTTTDRPTEESVLTGLDEADPVLAEHIRSRLFTFDDLLGLGDRALQEVLRSAAGETVALALKGKPPEVVDRLVGAMTDRRAEQLLEDLAALPPKHMSEILEAEAALVQQALALDESGVITIERADDPLLA